MNENKLFCAMMQQLVIAGFLCTFYNLISSAVVKGFYPLMLFPYVAVIVFAINLFLLKERTARSLIIFASVLLILAELLVFLFSPEKSILEKMQAFPILFFFTCYTIRRLLKGTARRTMVRTFDISVILLLSFGAYISSHALAVELLYPAILSTLISFAGIIYIRQKEEGSSKNWPFALFSIALAAIAVIALVSYSSLLGEGMSLIRDFLIKIGESFLRFVDWLFSWIPKLFNIEDDGVLEWETDEQYRGNYQLNGIIDKRILELIVILIIVTIAFFTLLYFMKFLKVGGDKRKKKTIGEKRKRPSVKEAIQRALNFLVTSIRIKIFISRNKNSVKGLYFWIEKTLKKDEMRKRNGETAKEFLLRLSEVEELKGQSPALVHMADDINVIFYSPQKEKINLKMKEAKTIRAALEKIILKHRISILSDEFKSKIRKMRAKKESVTI